MCGDADGWGFPDDAIGGLLACCATFLLDYNLWIMSLFTQRGEKQISLEPHVTQLNEN